MATDTCNAISVLGAGTAGLAAAYYATRLGLRSTVYERAPHVGGSASTIVRGGFQFDTGAHRIHDKDPEITADIRHVLQGALHGVSAPSRIYSQGRLFRFPLTPGDLARGLGAAATARAAADLARARWRHHDGEANFERYARRRYGRSIADRFLLNYSEKLWGRPASQLAPDVAGGRVDGLRLRSVLFPALTTASRRSPHLDGSFYYPVDGGIGRVCERLAEAIGYDSIQLGAQVERICHRRGVVRTVVVNGVETGAGAAVLSSIPLPVLVAKLWPAPPAAVLEAAHALSYRSLVVVAVFIARERITPDATIYFPDPAFPFTRISEPRNRNPRMAPAGHTSLVAEVPCGAGDAEFRRSDTDLVSRVTAPIVDLGWIVPRDIVGHAVHRIEVAYPVLSTEAPGRADEVRRYLAGFRNLHLVGRSATFTYSHIHDHFRAGLEAAKTVLAGRRACGA